MIRKVETPFGRIEYCLERKKVKNINLRVKPDGSVHISASRFVSAKALDDFVVSKAEFVFRAFERYKKRFCASLQALRRDYKAKGRSL